MTSILLLMVVCPLLATPSLGSGCSFAGDLRKEDYEVYSRVLAEMATGESIVIQQTTAIFKLEPWVPKIEKEVGQALKKALVQDADEKFQRSANLEQCFSAERKHVLVSREDISRLFQETGWDGFHRRFGKSATLVSLSRVGFNEKRDAALVYFSQSGWYLGGTGHVVLLIKRKGVWKIRSKALILVS